MCEPEVIRQQMEETRTALAGKLETLEQQVVDTVAGANTAVTETVATVKDAVQETVEVVKGTVQDTAQSVRQALDLPRQVDQHPWLFFGGSVALGFVSGWLVRRTVGAVEKGAARGEFLAPSMVHAGSQTNGHKDYPHRQWPQEVPTPASRQETNWLGSLGKEFSQEINKVKSLAIGVGVGLVRDMISQSAPDQLRPQLTQVMDNLTTKLGGETIPGPLLPPRSEPEGQQEPLLHRPSSRAEERPLGAACGSV
jgi:ElaB/YqjD/DUF883 family membrane-anchored ribosome-binding protein